MRDYKKLLSLPEYQFLKDNPHLGSHITLLGLGGSVSYGTNLPESDIDIRGVATNSCSDLLGLTNFDQVVDNATDTTIYSLNKIVRLLLNCNPNVIELLGLRPEHYLYIGDIGQKLLDNKVLFLSQRAVYSFGGYASQQLMRLKNNLARYSVSDNEKEQHILATLQRSMRSFEERYNDFGAGSIQLYIDQSDREEMDTEIYMDVQLKHYPLRDYKFIWSEMNTIVKDYSKIGKRNKKKDDAHLAKHMMHLLRLYMMCLDILQKGEIITYRENEHALLMDIRNGYFLDNGTVKQEFWDLLASYEKQFAIAVEKTKLPMNPDYEIINKLMIDMNKVALEDGN